MTFTVSDKDLSKICVNAAVLYWIEYQEDDQISSVSAYHVLNVLEKPKAHQITIFCAR